MSDFGLVLVLFAALCGAVVLIRIFAWLTDVREAGGPVAYVRQTSVRYVVKHSQDAPPVVMSRTPINDRPSMPSSVQTDGVQTPDQTEDTAARRQKLLDTYRPLRKLGMSRDDARVFLSRWNIPLDNNLWADAAPPDDVHRTPIVGRPTSAVFETDPDYPYQAPA